MQFESEQHLSSSLPGAATDRAWFTDRTLDRSTTLLRTVWSERKNNQHTFGSAPSLKETQESFYRRNVVCGPILWATCPVQTMYPGWVNAQGGKGEEANSPQQDLRSHSVQPHLWSHFLINRHMKEATSKHSLCAHSLERVSCMHTCTQRRLSA